MLKRKVTELKGVYYSLKWTNIALSTCPNNSVCWNTTDVCVISTADDLLVCMSTQLSAVDPTRVCLLSKISCFTRISWQSFPLQWYFKVICRFWIHQSHWCSNIPKFKRLRSGDHAGQVSGLLRLILCPLKIRFECCPTCEENEVVPHHAWNTCVVDDENAHQPRPS